MLPISRNQSRNQSHNHAKCQIQVAICFALWLLFAAAACANDSAVTEDQVPQSVKNLDLCTLAYQLYHQSLCLPLDPWYDTMSRIGSDRRNNICRFTHEYAANIGSRQASYSSQEPGAYSGPNAARGWLHTNTNLDPILTNYMHVDARLPAFTRDGGCFTALHAPTYLTENIKVIEALRYKSKPVAFPANDVEVIKVHDYPNGKDHLIVFEGGTGVVGATEPSWSLMGFVLMEKTATGYDAHIVFRGSRSGSSLAKTIWKAQEIIGEAKGNPDWITDLRGISQVDSPLVSRVGKVTQGFAESLPTMLGPVAACCKHLEDNYPAPEHIYVTGHSLGAGLASQFVSAVAQGSYGDELRRQVKSWPWNKITLVAFAQPIPGDPAWAANFNKVVPDAEHYWVEGDEVVEASSGTLVGLLIDKGEHSGVQHKLSKVENSSENPHEVFIIRAAMLRDLSAGGSEVAQRLSKESTWGYYDSFSRMLAGLPKSYVYPGASASAIVNPGNLPQVLQNYHFSPEFYRWLEAVYARMIADKDSYIGFKFQSTLDERKKLVLDIAEWMKRAPAGERGQELTDVVSEFNRIDGNLGLTNEEQLIYLGMILSRIQNSSLTVDDLQTNSSTKNCLDASVD